MVPLADVVKLMRRSIHLTQNTTQCDSFMPTELFPFLRPPHAGSPLLGTIACSRAAAHTFYIASAANARELEGPEEVREMCFLICRVLCFGK